MTAKIQGRAFRAFQGVRRIHRSKPFSVRAGSSRALRLYGHPAWISFVAWIGCGPCAFRSL